eukprot:gene15402-18266_t
MLAVSAINTQQQQQTQHIQQIQQNRKFYYHFKYNATAGTPTPQLTGLVSRAAEAAANTATLSSTTTSSSTQQTNNGGRTTPRPLVLVQTSHQHHMDIDSNLVSPVILSEDEEGDIKHLAIHPSEILFKQGPHFDSDFLRSYVLQPGERISVQILFTPMDVGDHETLFHIQTNYGGLIFYAQGQASNNFYKLSSIYEQVMADTQYSHPIYLYNPHNTTIKITEVYTNGGSFLLALPNNKQQGGEDNPWSSHAGPFTGLVNIETSVDNLTVQVEILSVRDGVHISPNEIDFGYITSKTDYKSVSLFVLNADAHSDLKIMEIHPKVPDARLRFFLHDDVITPGRSKVEIAHFFFNSNVEGLFKGIIVIKVLGYKDIEVPYRAQVLHGDLSYHPKDVLFPVETKKLPDIIRPNQLVLKNNFEVPLTILAVHIADSLFQIQNAPLGATIAPHAQLAPISILFDQRGVIRGRHSSLLVDTNISTFEVDLHAFNGHLVFSTSTQSDLVSLDKSKPLSLEFGVLGQSDVRFQTFRIRNPNPFPLILTYGLKKKGDAFLRLRLVLDENGAPGVPIDHSVNHFVKPAKTGMLIDSGHTITFELEIAGKDRSTGLGSGEFTIKSQLENMTITYQYRIMEGSLSIAPSELDFGTIALYNNPITIPLLATSTYSIPVNVSSVDASSPHVRCQLLTNTLRPKTETHFANIVFQPVDILPEDLKTLVGDENLYDFFTQNEIFWIFKNRSMHIPSTLTIHTDIMTNFVIQTTGQLVRPPLESYQQNRERTNYTTIDYGLVIIGQSDSRDLEIYNPFDIPVEAWLLPPETAETMSDRSNPPRIHSSVIHVLREALVPTRIAPHSSHNFGPVKFQPTNTTDYDLTLYLRNNYTIIHMVHITGRGVGGRLAFVAGDPKTGDEETVGLVLELNRTHLSPCFFGRSATDINADVLVDATRIHPKAPIEVARAFTLVNRGNHPLDIRDVFIGDYKCQSASQKCMSAGFKLLNFADIIFAHLEPGESINVHLAYEPDFSTSLLKRELVIRTNQDAFTFPIVGSMPHEYLPLCTHLRPSLIYEYPAKIVFIICMVILFLMLIFLTFREYSKPLQHTTSSSRGHVKQHHQSVDSADYAHHFFASSDHQSPDKSVGEYRPVVKKKKITNSNSTTASSSKHSIAINNTTTTSDMEMVENVKKVLMDSPAIEHMAKSKKNQQHSSSSSSSSTISPSLTSHQQQVGNNSSETLNSGETTPVNEETIDSGLSSSTELMTPDTSSPSVLVLEGKNNASPTISPTSEVAAKKSESPPPQLKTSLDKTKQRKTASYNKKVIEDPIEPSFEFFYERKVPNKTSVPSIKVEVQPIPSAQKEVKKNKFEKVPKVQKVYVPKVPQPLVPPPTTTTTFAQPLPTHNIYNPFPFASTGELFGNSSNSIISPLIHADSSSGNNVSNVSSSRGLNTSGGNNPIWRDHFGVIGSGKTTGGSSSSTAPIGKPLSSTNSLLRDDHHTDHFLQGFKMMQQQPPQTDTSSSLSSNTSQFLPSQFFGSHQFTPSTFQSTGSINNNNNNNQSLNFTPTYDLFNTTNHFFNSQPASPPNQQSKPSPNSLSPPSSTNFHPLNKQQ